MKKTMRGLRLCAKWLAYCLRVGWRRNQLDALESLWWAHHDGNGNLTQGGGNG